MKRRDVDRRWRSLPLFLTAALAACATTTDELGSIAELPPLDRAVLVTGGAFLAGPPGAAGTFHFDDATGAEVTEPIPFAAILAALQRGRVFRRLAADDDAEQRRGVVRSLAPGRAAGAGDAYLQQARDDGYDLLLVIEELQDGVVDRQGTNGRWPVTFVTWILLGVGALIPDRTFESRSSLRVSLRELQDGRVLHELLLVPGPVELALAERTDVWGLLMSVLVPPFWVGDDDRAVRRAVREHAERRLLLSLARELKSEAVRRHVDSEVAASITLQAGRPTPRVVVLTDEDLSVVALVGDGLGAVAVRDFEQTLLASRLRDGERWRYEAALPAGARGLVQVLVGTLRGGVASATFAPQEVAER
ncbi:MAG: hypothetical protein H6835_00370 [Planctomycetes bacterium]|nr:hypothetical protein [Planctomycetota bacterium]